MQDLSQRFCPIYFCTGNGEFIASELWLSFNVISYKINAWWLRIYSRFDLLKLFAQVIYHIDLMEREREREKHLCGHLKFFHLLL